MFLPPFHSDPPLSALIPVFVDVFSTSTYYVTVGLVIGAVASILAIITVFLLVERAWKWKHTEQCKNCGEYTDAIDQYTWCEGCARKTWIDVMYRFNIARLRWEYQQCE